MGHNTAHHGFNNLKGRDQVWAPYSKAEFDALPGYRRALERLYRSGLGWGAYYLYEMWWKKLYFASKKEIGSSRRKYKLDSLLVTAFAAAWIGVVAYAAAATEQSVALLRHAGRDRAVPAVERRDRLRGLPAPHEPEHRLVPEPPGMAAQPCVPHVHRLRALPVGHGPPDAQHHGTQRASPEPGHPDVHAARGAAGAARQVPGPVRLPHRRAAPTWTSCSAASCTTSPITAGWTSTAR